MRIVDRYSLSTMRPSPLRHPLAVLRKMIGLNQSELAALCSCSPRTIQAVELLKLPLSGKLASKISAATGVSVESLLDADPAAPLRTGHSPAWGSTGNEFSKDLYERHRAFTEIRETALVVSIPFSSSARKRAHELHQFKRQMGSDFEEADREIVELCAGLLKATREHEQNYVIRWQVKKFLSKQFAEFGASTSHPNTDHSATHPPAKPRRG